MKTGFENGKAYATEIKSTQTLQDRIINGDMSQWDSIAELPDDFRVERVEEGDVSPYVAKSSDASVGSALDVTCYLDYPGVGFISPGLTKGDFGDGSTIQIKVTAKRATGTPNLGIVIGCAVGEDRKVYDWAAEAWVNEGESGPVADEFKIETLTDSYAEVDFGEITFPVGATKGFFFVLGVGAENDVVRIDKYESLIDDVDTATNGNLVNWSPTGSGLQGYTVGQASDTEPEISLESTKVDSGDYAAKATINKDSTAYFWLEQLIAKDVKSNNLFSFKGAGESTADLFASWVFYDDDEATATQEYDHDDNTWKTKGTATTLRKPITLTNDYAINSVEIPYPASDKILARIELHTDSGMNVDQTYYLDSVKGVEAVEAILLEKSDLTTAELPDEQVLLRKLVGDTEVMLINKDGSGKMGSLQWNASGAVTSGGA